MDIICSRKPGLSNAWYEAAQYLDEVYEAEYRGWKSTTQLVAPTRMVLLYERHDHEMCEDVQERANIIGGSGTHEILKMAAEHYGHKLCEQRFTIPFSEREIGIKADRVDPIPNTEPLEFKLIEFKECKTWAIILGEKEDWIWQCRIQAYALRQIGINVTQAQVDALIKDWSISNLEKAQREHKDYPEHQILDIHIDLGSDSEVEEYLSSRIQLLLENETVPDDELPECTPKERWMRDECFKIWKRGKTDKASVATVKDENGRRVPMTTRQMAEDAMEEKGYSTADYEIRYHPGQCTRCKHYCTARTFCNQYLASQKEGF